jgi:hypothetical protein
MALRKFQALSPEGERAFFIAVSLLTAVAADTRMSAGAGTGETNDQNRNLR